MALVVEDGTGLANAESYVDVAYCDAYFTARNNTTWAAIATSALKEGYIRQAMDYLSLYTRSWKGSRLQLGQALDWPRWNVVRPEITDYLTLDPNVIPVEIKNAVAELALRASAGPLLPDETSPFVLKEAVGPLSREYAPGSSRTPRYGAIEGLLGPFLRSSGGVSLVRG